MDITKSSLRNLLGPAMIVPFRKILYSPRLTFGAKVLAFAILDTPPTSDITNAKLARRLGSDPAQVSVWRKQLIYQKMDPRAKTGERL